MAQYKYNTHLTQVSDSAFDALHKPGESTLHSGIFRCEGCGREIVSESLKTMPPQNHHQHSNQNVPIQWKLLVRTS
jgi:hypothetical protein